MSFNPLDIFLRGIRDFVKGEPLSAAKMNRILAGLRFALNIQGDGVYVDSSGIHIRQHRRMPGGGQPMLALRVQSFTLHSVKRWKYTNRRVKWSPTLNKFASDPDHPENLTCFNLYEHNNTNLKVGHGIDITGTLTIQPIPANEIVFGQQIGLDNQSNPVYGFYAINKFTGCPEL